MLADMRPGSAAAAGAPADALLFEVDSGLICSPSSGRNSPAGVVVEDNNDDFGDDIWMTAGAMAQPMSSMTPCCAMTVDSP
jgi:hypothetical protein